MGKNNNNITKKCKKCEEFKLLEEFYKHPTTRDGYFSKCKSCIDDGAKKYRMSKKYKESAKKYYQTQKTKKLNEGVNQNSS